MQLKKLRIPISILCGIVLILFGVFIFSNFIYSGLTLQNNIFPLLQNVNTFADGVYELLSVSFTINAFQTFAQSSSASALMTILMSPTVWPLFLTWTTTGFLVGVIAKGFKRSFFTALGLFAIILLLLLIFGLMGANVGEAFTTAIANTLGQIVSAAIVFIPLTIVGGAISGPYNAE
jgi:hypothetical protein